MLKSSIIQKGLILTNIDKNIEDIKNLLKNTDVFKIKKCLYKIEGEELTTIISSLRECRLPKQYKTYKDVFKEQLKLALDLKQSDNIFFNNGVIYVKIFLQVESKNTKEKRACGLEPELLESYKNDYFSDDSHKKVVFELLDSALEDTIGFRLINPIKFSKVFIPVFINIFDIVIVETTDLSEEVVIRGFSLFLLREMFDEMMFYIAEDILFNFSNADKKAIEFLSYLSVNEKIDSKGVKYKPRPILDESNHAWNITTIRSTMIQHKKAKQALYDKKARLITVKKRLEEYDFDILGLNSKMKLQEDELYNIENKIENIKNTLRKLESGDSHNIKYVEEGIERVYEKKPLIVKLFKKEDLLLSQKSLQKKKIDELHLKIDNKQKDITTWQKKYSDDKNLLEMIKKKGHPTDKLYKRIKKALAKTLAKR